MLKKLHATLNNTPCANASRITFMQVINDLGSVIGVHPTPLNVEPCEQEAISTLKSFSFYTAEYDGEK